MFSIITLLLFVVLRIQTKGFKQQTTKQKDSNKRIQTKGFKQKDSNKSIQTIAIIVALLFFEYVKQKKHNHDLPKKETLFFNLFLPFSSFFFEKGRKRMKRLVFLYLFLVSLLEGNLWKTFIVVKGISKEEQSLFYQPF